jgi:hypothetical protein
VRQRLLGEGVAELGRQAKSLSRAAALVGGLICIAVLAVAVAAVLAAPGDLLGLAAAAVLMWVGVTGLVIAIMRFRG